MNDLHEPLLKVASQLNAEKKHPRRSSSKFGLFVTTHRLRLRILLHVAIVPCISCTLWTFLDKENDLEHPFMGLYFPTLAYTTIGLAVPIELFLIETLGIALCHQLVSPLFAYNLMLFCILLMGIMIGFRAMNRLATLENENRKKKNDDDLEEEEEGMFGTKDVVAAAGKELELLRQEEQMRLRERKNLREKSKEQVLLVTAIPMDSVDCVV